MATIAPAALSIAGVGHARADVIGLYNTGVDVNPTTLADNAWTIVGAGSGSSHPALTYRSHAYADSPASGSFPFNGYWVSNSSASSWDTPTNPFTGNLDPNSNGTYVYQTQFTITGSVLPVNSLALQFAADNEVSSITLNGKTFYTGPNDGTSQYGSFVSAVANNFLQSGVNTLDFTVVNYAQNTGNPSGLNVEFGAVTGDPAPVPGPAPGTGLASLSFFVVAGAFRMRKFLVR